MSRLHEWIFALTSCLGVIGVAVLSAGDSSVRVLSIGEMRLLNGGNENTKKGIAFCDDITQGITNCQGLSYGDLCTVCYGGTFRVVGKGTQKFKVSSVGSQDCGPIYNG